MMGNGTPTMILTATILGLKKASSSGAKEPNPMEDHAIMQVMIKLRSAPAVYKEASTGRRM